MTARSERTWWIGSRSDGSRGYLVVPPGADLDGAKDGSGLVDLVEVPPAEFYRSIVDDELAKPVRDEAYLEAMEETLEQWERVSEA